jgi:predicted nucleic acid-binding protein
VTSALVCGYKASKRQTVGKNISQRLTHLWRKVSELGWKLGRKGKWPPATDITIAACALRIGATLISPDAHFIDVPGLILVPDLSLL